MIAEIASCILSQYLWYRESIQVLRESTLYRSSHRRGSVKKGVVRNFSEFLRLRPATLLKRSLWHRCFPVNFEKFLRNLFYRTLLVAASDSTQKFLLSMATINAFYSRKMETNYQRRLWKCYYFYHSLPSLNQRLKSYNCR